MNLITSFLGIVSNYIIVRHAKRFILFSKSSACGIKNSIVKTAHPSWFEMRLSKEKAGKKVPFFSWIKWNTERRRSICDCFCPVFFKYGAAQLIRSKSHANLPPASFRLFPSRKAIVMHTKKPNQTCDCLQIIRFFNLRRIFFPASFLIFFH